MKKQFQQEYDRICKLLKKKGLNRAEYDKHKTGPQAQTLKRKLGFDSWEELVHSINRRTSLEYYIHKNDSTRYSKINCLRYKGKIVKAECCPKYEECANCPDKQDNFAGVPDIPDEKVYYQSVGELTNFSVQG